MQRLSNIPGKLKIHVEPKQAYVFVDGKAIRDGSQTIVLASGDHRGFQYSMWRVSRGGRC